MRQSKYSKRRPTGGISYSQHDIKDRRIGINTELRKPARYLDAYDVGYFIDDEREMSDVELPVAKKWVVLRSYGQCVTEILRNEHLEKAGTVFISFDHYLEKTDGNRFTGQDCMNVFRMHKSMVGDRIDIQGHSSDSVKNEEKMNIWYLGR